MAGKLVVTDLDGTLWGPSRQVHPAARDALDELSNRGVPVLVATARRRASVRQAAHRHGLSLGGVLIDGALGYEDLDGTAFHQQPLADHEVSAVVAIFDQYGHEPMFETDEVVPEIIIGRRPSMPAAFFDANPTLRCDLSADLPLPVFSAVAIVEPDVGEKLLAGVIAAGVAAGWLDRNPAFGDTCVIKVRSPTCTKWSTVARYCDLHGITTSDVVAIGNDDNDVELLAAAGIGLAVADASPSALSVADHVVPAADDGGWSAVLDHV